MPNQPTDADLSPLRDLEAKPVVCNIVVASPIDRLDSYYSSYRTLLYVTARSLRMSHNWLAKSRGHTRVTTNSLSPTELTQAESFLFSCSQNQSFPDELSRLRAHPSHPLRASSKLLTLNPFSGTDGLLHVGGRLSNADLAHSQKHPIILSSKDHLVATMLKYDRVCLGHCGPTLLISNAGTRLHILGARRLARSICSHAGNQQLE